MNNVFITLNNFIAGSLPDPMPQWPNPEILDHIWIAPLEPSLLGRGEYLFSAELLFEEELVLLIPGVDAVGIALAPGGGGSIVAIEIDAAPRFELRLVDVPVALRLDADLLRPVRRVTSESPDELDRFEVNSEVEHIDITLAELTFTVNCEGNISLDVSSSIGLPLSMISDTGVVIQAEDIQLALGLTSPPPGRPAGWRGLYMARLNLYLPRELASVVGNLELTEAYIGNGGFSGTITQSWSPTLTAELFGSQLGLRSVQIAIVQNAFTKSEILGVFTLSFFDAPIEILLGLDQSGDFIAQLSGSDESGLYTLTKENLFTLQLESITFQVISDLFSVTLSGKIKPLLGGLDWPGFELRKLTVDGDGNVDIDGGWIEIPDSLTLDFHGFKIQITEFGMGNEIRPEGATEEAGEARQWVGLSGSIALVEGIPISASVEGLKFSWPKAGGGVEVSLSGIALSLEIPNTLKLEGSVSYKKLKPEDNPQGLSGHIFKGHVDLNLMALRTQIAGQIIIGRVTDAAGHEFTVFYIALKAELPSAIALGATGTGIYGLAGLFGMHIGPDRHLVDGEEESWYEWYKADRGEAYSVVPVDKWKPLYDNYAFGAGLTLGTIYDDGFTINGNLLVTVLIPGPVIMIEGKVDLLKQRSDDKTEEGALYALVVFDGRAGTFQMNIDVRYSLEGVISVGGGMEAFFDFNDATAWYIHIGKKDPESKRIQAEILSLVTAKAYFMIDNFGLQTGAFVGVDWQAEYGPVRLAILARFSFDATIFWKPVHLEGAIELYGEISLTIFGIGIEIILQLLLAARAPSPYWIHGKAKLKLSLFWPLPTIDLEAEFTWEEERPAEPVTPLLKGASLLHHKMPGASWAVAVSTDDALEAPPENVPIFPVDARPVLSFARRISGLPGGASGQQNFTGIPADEVGDFTFRYQIEDVHLEVYVEDTGWTTVRQGINDGDESFKIDDLSFVNGWDAQEPQIELWRNHALDARSLSEREQFADRYPPCPVPSPAPRHCVDWQLDPEGFTFPHSFRYQGIQFRAAIIGQPAIPPTVQEQRNIHLLAVRGRLSIHLPEPVSWLEIKLFETSEEPVVMAFYQGESVEITHERVDDFLKFVINVPVDLVILNASSSLFKEETSPDEQEIFELQLVSVCYKTVSEMAREARTTPGDRRVHDEASIGKALILQPNQNYRLTVNTLTEGDPNLVQIIEHENGSEEWKKIDPIHKKSQFYFRTDGGPGTAPEEENSSLPAPTDGDAIQRASHAGTPVNTLAAYLGGTTPLHGATNHYYTYDIRLDFNEAYARQMYEAPLEIRVRDRNGRLVKDKDGNLTGIPMGFFLSGAIGNMPSGWLTLLAAEESGRCIEPTKPHDQPVLYRPAPRGLKPQRMYTAEVVTEKWDHPEQALHTVQFATSRYSDVKAHLTSGRRDDEQVVRPRFPIASIGLDWREDQRKKREDLGEARRALESVLADKEQPNIIHERLIQAQEAWTALHTANAAAFKTIAGVAEALTAPLPPALEFVPMEVASTESLFILLESPEPLDWARLSVTCDVPLCLVWNDDQTRVFIFHDEDVWISPKTYEFEFTFSGDKHPELPTISVKGKPVNESIQSKVDLT